MIRILSVGCGTDDDPWVAVSGRPEDTEQLGALLAGLLRDNSVISLVGDLGAGKTAFVRGLARGLGCQGPVASPTFTLLMEHPAGPLGLALYHFDVYRLERPDAPDTFQNLGLAEYFEGGGVCAIEWGDRIAELLPRHTLTLRLLCQLQDDEQTRRLELFWPDGRQMLEQLVQAVAIERAAESSCPGSPSESECDVLC